MDTEIDRFLRYLAVEKGLSENYQLSVRRSLESFKEYLGETRNIHSWGKVTLTDITDYLGVRRLEDSISAATLRVNLIALKIFFRHLAAKGTIPEDIAEQVDSPKTEKQLPETLDPGSVSRLLESIDDALPLARRDRAILELLYSSGLRVSEAASARLENLSLEESAIRVTGKGNKTRIVPVGSKARESLVEYLEGERPQLVRTHSSSEIFLSKWGKKLTTTRIWQIVKQRARTAGLEGNIYPHLLRHSFATHLLGNGADLRVIQELLGHADIATTQIYTHVDQQQLRNVHRKFHPRG